MMSIPGFTAESSLGELSGRYRYNVAPSVGHMISESRVYMQKPNSQNTAGGSCYGFTSGTLIKGTYDSLGRCCTYPPNAFPFCIDCDVDKCYDRASVILGGLRSGNFQSGVFARF